MRGHYKIYKEITLLFAQRNYLTEIYIYNTPCTTVINNNFVVKYLQQSFNPDLTVPKSGLYPPTGCVLLGYELSPAAPRSAAPREAWAGAAASQTDCVGW